ncbi:hypothetical protein A2673_00645 [Candidatus Kaiserbacteria bacterium RIFCSPHIGHO2_01_FULL_50_13]|uniref:Metallo-beta-lactamase domain-containing protein n=1 Tax=Candidatus Kaiserbacteria bacterium RIFCSPLOWO2_01_FULL_50_24 TaxID=1798507 RepID=A0A1F6ERI5_9BACT|nr:MAG: hypothetical protein A2673_00645 [Candidatus Kaiserbacteria bacterium RIFCSPHIGHO2_01_FULL_50_13]OGG76233.1 MAG: hypothetical protein A3A34_03295 [Candidatus Kaiserbacteria bacterium RIFCSPLOWO2_01_FULL_50_24]OGG81814.1 MAG: hypothetical protein A3H74_02675 [Candidatus Kaiserbacteria bacterium RIFCSPLOWO2_02_FULL_51_13]
MWKWAREHAHVTLILVLVAVSAIVWSAVWRESSKVLTVSFLNVGQGDAIFIETPSGAQMLVDGGKNRAVLRELSRVSSWYDRTIDVAVATHPDQDHIGGLVDVLERYRVNTVIESGVLDNGAGITAFEKAVAEENVRPVRGRASNGARRHIATRGDVIDFGDGVYFEILFPDRAVPGLETNTASVIGRLVYGNTSFMLTGDSPQTIEEYLVRIGTERLPAQVLKVGHHGSKTSSSPLFLGYVNPNFAVYSRGCDNSYGHPHADVVALFKQFEIETFDTCTDGTITFVSDGQTVGLR